MYVILRHFLQNANAHLSSETDLPNKVFGNQYYGFDHLFYLNIAKGLNMQMGLLNSPLIYCQGQPLDPALHQQTFCVSCFCLDFTSHVFTCTQFSAVPTCPNLKPYLSYLVELVSLVVSVKHLCGSIVLSLNIWGIDNTDKVITLPE